jgi:hypothetical protein
MLKRMIDQESKGGEHRCASKDEMYMVGYELPKTNVMKARISFIRKVSLGILLIGFILGASSCASSKTSAGHRNDIAQGYNQASKRGQGVSVQPDRSSQNRVQKSEGMKGPYKPQQDNYQQRDPGPGGGGGHVNGLGAAIAGVIFWILNGLSGGNR